MANEWQDEHKLPEVSKGLSLLVVEDCEQTRAFLRQVFGEYSFGRIDLAAGADEGFDLYRKHRHDLVITDLDLPGQKSGLDLIEAIQALHAPNVKPVIAYTRFDQHRFAQSLLKKRGLEGMLVSKPHAGRTAPYAFRKAHEGAGDVHPLLAKVAELAAHCQMFHAAEEISAQEHQRHSE